MSQSSGTDEGGRQQQYLDAMGILRWQLRHQDTSADINVSQSVDAPMTSGGVVSERRPEVIPETGITNEDRSDNDQRSDIAAMDWDTLRSRVSSCTVCELHASRTQTVFGVGSRHADWLVIGEAPGADEDKQGEPFVGRAGQLLNAMLLACGLKREQVYIANILKCRPPSNRDPKAEEVLCCEAFLLRQIELIQPRLILAVGRIAAQNLLQSDTPIGKLRGSVHRFRDSGIPLIATYHPAYLLRSPAEKRKAWQDLQLAMQTVQEGSS